MATKEFELPMIIVERVEASHPGAALFSAAETVSWPEGSLDCLCECGLLQPAPQAHAILCPGCEWQCHKPVVVRAASAGQRHAFIVCDEEPAYGRQPIGLQNLNQYRSTIDCLAVFFAAQLKLGVRQSPFLVESFLLGAITGRYGLRQVSIGLGAGQLELRVGRQIESVTRVLCWSASGPSIDRAHIRRLANRKEPTPRRSGAYLPDRTRQKARTREKSSRNEAIFREAKRLRARGASWTASADAIALTELATTDRGGRLAAPTVRRIVTDMRRREWENSRSNREVRN